MNIQSVSGFAPARPDERVAGAESAAPAKAPAPPDRASADASRSSEPSREQVSEAVDKIKQSLPASAQSLEFSIDESSKQTVVKVIDQDTREVVRQMPSEEALALAKALDKALGHLIKETA